MDQRSAIIISGQDGDFSIGEKVKAEDHQSGKSEHASNRGEVADHRKYYKTLAGKVLEYDEVLVFGPGQSQEEFQNYLKKDSHFKGKITIDSANQLTDPQIIAKVRDFFKSKA